MNEISLATWAGIWRARLHHGIADLQELKLSADHWIDRLESPPNWLIDAALSRSKAEALTAVGSCSDSPNADQVFAALMGGWRDLLAKDPESAERIAQALFFMAANEDYVPSPEASTDMLWFWDAIDLAGNGCFGDDETVRSKLCGFLHKWAQVGAGQERPLEGGS